MMRLLLIAFLFVYTTAEAQQPSVWKRVFTRPPYDTAYVDSYYDHFLHVTLVGVLQDQNLQFTDPQGLTLKYAPNGAFRFGVGLDYRYFSIEYTHTIDQVDEPDPQKGTSENFSLRLGVTGRRVLGSLLLQSNKGMYLTNSDKVIPGWDPAVDGYMKRGDIESQVVLGSLNYFFNHTHYSTMASLWQIDRQKKSAGSFCTGITASITHLNSDSSFVPTASSATLPSDQRIKETYTFLGGINAGYAHNFIFKQKFFFNLMLIPGIDVQFGHFRAFDGQNYDYKATLGFHGDVRFIAGYNGERYYSGVHYSNYFLNNRIESYVDINTFNGYLRFFVGRRFDLTPKKKR